MKVNRSMVPVEFFGDGNPTHPQKQFGRVENREAVDYPAVDAWVAGRPERLESLDGQLARGVLPEGLETLTNAGMVAEMKKEVVIPTLIPAAISSTFVGGCLGVLLGSYLGRPALLFGLGGAVLAGGLHTLRKYRTFAGKVNVELDGHRATRGFYMYPHLYRREPDEIRHLLRQKGALGDRIDPVRLSAGAVPAALDPRILQRLAPFAGRLMQLGAERRLVADLGARSRYGKPALSLVDAALAQRLLAGGTGWSGKLFLVHGENTTRTTHTYAVEGGSFNGSSRLDDRYDYDELSFRYRLQPLDAPEALASVPPAEGLPKAMGGVYRDSDLFSQVDRTSEHGRLEGAESWGFLDGELDAIGHETSQLGDRKTRTR